MRLRTLQFPADDILNHCTEVASCDRFPYLATAGAPDNTGPARIKTSYNRRLPTGVIKPPPTIRSGAAEVICFPVVRAACPSVYCGPSVSLILRDGICGGTLIKLVPQPPFIM